MLSLSEVRAPIQETIFLLKYQVIVLVLIRMRQTGDVLFEFCKIYLNTADLQLRSLYIILLL